MSTVTEIEAAIEHLSANEVRKLKDWLFSRQLNPVRPKTGAELAKLWPSRFHLSSAEAEALVIDLNDSQGKPIVQPLAWE